MKTIGIKNNNHDFAIESYVFANNSIPMAITNKDLVVVAANEAAQNLLGFNNGTLIGKTVYELNANGTFAFDVDKLKQLIDGEIHSYFIPRKYLNKNSEVVEGNLLVSLIEIDGEKYFSGIFVDIAQIQRNEEVDKTRRYEMLSTILSTSPDIQYIMDVPRRQYLYKNIDLLHFLGYEDTDVPSDKTRWEFLKEKMDENSVVIFKDGKRYLSEIKKIGEFTDIEYRILCKDGSYKWLRERSTPLVFGLNSQIQYCYTIMQDVTDKREIYEKVLEQQTLIEKVADITPDIIFVYEFNTLKNIYNNFGGRTFLGYNEKDWGQIGVRTLRDEENSILLNHFLKLQNARETDLIEDELAVKALDGSQKWIMAKSKVFKYDESGKPLQILSLITDISDFKKAILLAEKSEKTQRAILEAIPELIFKMNQDGVYLEAIPSKINDGYNPPIKNVIGKTIFDVLPFTTASLIKNELDQAFKKNEIRSFEFERELDGKLFYLENHISPISETEAVIIARNISNRKKMQQAVEEKVLELSSKNIELEKYITKNKELERFAYIVSHDLKEPLRTINAFTEIIKSRYITGLDNDAKMYFDFITTSTQRMTALIEGILDYSKIEVNAKAFETEDTSDLVGKVLKDLSKSIEENEAVIEFDNLSPVYCDSLQIRQLFQNLISNALKFRKSDVNPVIKITSEVRTNDVLFTVSDNGIGIDPVHFDTIFDMFKRLHPRDTFKGQGIGLALCKRIIERHGGDIWLESDGKNGTKFFFTIPKPKI